MTNGRLGNQEPLAATWAVIEAKRSLPATIAVVGATDQDDTASVGRGLASSAAMAGRRTAYLSDNGGAQRDGYDVLSLPSMTGAAFHERVQIWRGQYDVLILDVPNVLDTTVGAQMTRSADGVIVALCADRSIVAQDRRLGTFLEQLGVKTLGVVQTAPPKTIRDAPTMRFAFKRMGRTLRSLVSRT